ncbi:hypothetical protein GQ54DRAFT_261693, partial [Martensiomyces pterosporus]
MAVIRHALASQNLPESALEHQLAALAVKTNKIYNINWLRWAKWARSNSIDPTVYSPNNFARFLYAAKIPRSSLMSVRAAVHNTWRHISPDSPPLSENQVINNFFTSSKRTQRIARAQRGIPVKPPTWDVSQVINTVSAWGANAKLTLLKLSQKSAMLLALASMWRPRSDIGRLQ